MKRFIALLGLASFASLAAADLNKVEAPAEAAALVITAKPVPLNKDNPRQTRVGELIYRGGLELRSPNRNFGGISGMRLWDDTTVLAIGDTGIWVSFKLIEKKGQLVGVKGIALAPILDKDGKTGTKKDRDAEAIATDHISNTIIAFEGQNAFWHFFDIDPAKRQTFANAAVSVDTPDAMKLWPVNGGPEAFDFGQFGGSHGTVYRAPKPQQLTLAEDAFDNSGTTAGMIAYPSARLFRYLPPAGFKPTDAQLLSDVEALVLHRHFSPATGVAASIGDIDLEKAESAEPVTPREIARLAPPLTVDNMEGISYIERKGRKFIYIISDDNFSGLQRTLLMKFEWLPLTK